MSNKKMMVVVGAKTSEFDKAMKGLKKSMKSVSRKMTEVGKGLTSTVTLPIVAMGSAAVAAGLEVDKAMDIIRAGTGATGDTLAGLGKDFEPVFKGVPQSAEQVGQAIADLNTRTGLSGKSLQGLAKQMLNLSRVSGVEVGPLIESTTRLFGDWSVATDDQAQTLDYLFKVSQSTGIGVDNLSNKMVQFGAPLRQLGFDMQTSAALMGKWEKEGVNAELVLGSMRIALGRMAKEGITDANEALSVMVDKIKNAGTVGEANALAMEMFGARAGPDMAAAIREGRFEIDELLASINESGETINTAATDTLSFGDSMAVLRNQATLALAPLGEILLDLFEQAQPHIERLIAHVGQLVEWFKNLSPETQSVILTVVGLVAALGPLLVVMGTVIGAVVKILPLFAALGKIIIVVKAILIALAGPIGIIIAVVAALAFGVFMLIRNWDTVRTFFTDLWERVKETFANAVDSVIGFVQSLWTGAEQRFTGMVNHIRSILAGVTEAITAPFRRAQESVSKITGAIGGLLNRLNPFARNSPSLVDNVRAGVKAIRSEYNKLESLSMPNLAATATVTQVGGYGGGIAARMPQTTGQAAGDRQTGTTIEQHTDMVLEVDGVRLGRVVLPYLMRENQRIGTQIAEVR